MRAGAFALLAFFATPAFSDVIDARYAEPTTRYTHGVLGDAIEYGALKIRVRLDDGRIGRVSITLPQNRVFEDIAPRLVDIDNDNDLEVLVIESEAETGAAIAIYDETGRVTLTPHIGTKNRWLAPIGVADFNDDGAMDVAYIDRPHLLKRLRILTFRNNELVPLIDVDGLTNHQIGQDFISGGVRKCSDTKRPEIITANAGWTRIIATQIIKDKAIKRDLGPYTTPASLKAALNC